MSVLYIYRNVNTDIEVSKLCVGCMSFGKAGTMHDWTLDEAESENVIKHALDLGYNFFDTANGYSAGTSEEYLGKALKKNVARNQVVIASNVQSCMVPAFPKLMQPTHNFDTSISVFPSLPYSIVLSLS